MIGVEQTIHVVNTMSTFDVVVMSIATIAGICTIAAFVLNHLRRKRNNATKERKK